MGCHCFSSFSNLHSLNGAHLNIGADLDIKFKFLHLQVLYTFLPVLDLPGLPEFWCSNTLVL